MRLIDADAIKIPKGFFEKVDNVPKFYDWLNEQPTIDPVRHSKWIRITQGADPEKYICPLCHRTVEDYGPEPFVYIRYPYCHCGARMVEE